MLTKDIINQTLKKYERLLEKSDHEFLQRVFGEGIEKYIDRIKQYGFTNKNRILDAGCGYGQWSLAMRTLNKHVSSVDAAADRVLFLNDLIEKNEISNLDVSQASLSALPYEDNTFDAVFCYGVIFLTPWRESLKELTRVLRPGGSLYVNANGIGWYKHLWYNEPNACKKHQPRQIASKVLDQTYLYNNKSYIPPNSSINLMIEPHQLTEALTQAGYDPIRQASEGQLSSDGSVVSTPGFFQGEYLGDLGVYEIIARKK